MAWTDEKHAALVRLAAEGLSASEIGARIGMTRNAVIGRCWRKGVALPITEQKKRRNAWLSEREVVEIRARLVAGETQAALARRYFVSPRAISHIKCGDTWRHLLPTPADAESVSA